MAKRGRRRGGLLALRMRVAPALLVLMLPAAFPDRAFAATPPGEPAAATPATAAAAAPAAEAPAANDAYTPPPVQYDPSVLPEPVRALRERLIAAARAGDLEALAPLIAANPVAPIFTFGDQGDPIETLRGLSGDPEGREILAILLEVLESGFVRAEAGTPEELYIWPYFYMYPVEGLTGPQMVELFTLITAGDFAAMRDFGAYIFYRVGIGADGTWHFFVAGD